MDRKAPRGAHRYRPLWLRPVQGADRQVARPRPLPLRDHAALRGDQHARATGAGRRVVARASRHVRADPHRGEPRRDRLGARAVSRSGATISTSTPITGWPAGARCWLTACISARSRVRALSRRAARRWRTARPRTLFLGSGLFPAARAPRSAPPGSHVGLGTDIGAGTSFSLLATMGEAYKVAQLLRPPDRRGRGILPRDAGRRPRARARRSASARWRPGARPTWWCSIPTRRRCLAFRNRRSRSIDGDAGRAGDARRRPGRARDLRGGPVGPCAHLG